MSHDDHDATLENLLGQLAGYLVGAADLALPADWSRAALLISYVPLADGETDVVAVGWGAGEQADAEARSLFVLPLSMGAAVRDLALLLAAALEVDTAQSLETMAAVRAVRVGGDDEERDFELGTLLLAGDPESVANPVDPEAGEAALFLD